MIKKVEFNDVKKIDLNYSHDARGFFVETYNKKLLKTYDIQDNFVQDNLSLSLKKNTFRGFHFQIPPYEQSKLIKVISGSILDIFIDLRKFSKTFECFGICELTPESGLLYIPKGFAHGFLTLKDNTSVSYKVDNYYNAESESGIKWDDDFFPLNLNLSKEHIVISEKDSNLPLWIEIRDEVNFRE